MPESDKTTSLKAATDALPESAPDICRTLEPGEARFWAWYPIEDHPYFLLAHALVDAEAGELVTLGTVLDIEDGSELEVEDWDDEVFEEFEKKLLEVATNGEHASWDGWSFLKGIAFPRAKEGPARG